MVSMRGLLGGLWLWVGLWIVGLQIVCGQTNKNAQSGLAIESPLQLTLGDDREVLVRYRAPTYLGATLSVSTGTLGPPQATGDGRWQVRYTPPVARYPQVAIFALVSRDGNHFVWSRVALRGSAVVELSSDPNVSVSVKVGDGKFGPVNTDSRGRAAVKVLVPPGIKQAESAATDGLGNVRTQTISLDVPEIHPLLCVGPRESTEGFLVFATDDKGQPAANVPLHAETTTVSVTKTVAETDGVYRVLFAVPDNVRPGATAHLEVSTGGGGKAKTAAAMSCDIPLALEPPASIDVALSRPIFHAADEQPILVRVTPNYTGTGERSSVVLQLSSSVGELSRTRIATREPVEIEWRVPQKFGELRNALLEVRGDIHKDLPLALQTGSPTELQLRVDRETLPADGHATTKLRVNGVDAFGNPTELSQLDTQAIGTLTRFHAVRVGSYEAEYRAPYGREGTDVVSVTDRESGLKVSRELTLGDVRHRFALAARAGYLTNFARVSAPLGILQVGYRTPWLGERVKFSALAGYYQSQGFVGAQNSAQGVDVAVWALPLLVRAEYTFTFGMLDIGPVLGAGMLGAQSRVESADTGKYYDAHFVPLLAAGAIGGVGIGPGRVCAEVAYWAGSLQKDVLTGNAGGMNLSLGYELPL
jgi:hypothetical protein